MRFIAALSWIARATARGPALDRVRPEVEARDARLPHQPGDDSSSPRPILTGPAIGYRRIVDDRTP